MVLKIETDNKNVKQGKPTPVFPKFATGNEQTRGTMKVTITIEDDTKSGDITLSTQFSEGVSGATNSTAAWLGVKLIARATELTRERKRAKALQPPMPERIEFSL